MMLYWLIVGIVALGSCLLGFYLRETKNRLKLIETAVRALYVRQKQEEQKEKKMGYAEPINFEELSDAEKIDFLNM